ncbi:DUF6573 family protein [Streptomyces parvus]|uniref:DUF6573 family protein n=1 Tax=Streptomyces parvus TaxID=66428 RepID=UPI0021018F71|nr:DUF6573 family protein [Streptomyces parvus]MCQ1581238.1 hypothetical protein [Streptomyces parvus]
MKDTEIVSRIDTDLSVSKDAMRSSPSRAQAIADGELVAVEPGIAAEAGWNAPVAISRAAWDDCVAWSDEDTARQVPQDETGRLWDVLYMTAARARRGFDTDMYAELYRVPRGGRARKARLVRVRCSIGFGDEREPVITIRQADEA